MDRIGGTERNRDTGRRCRARRQRIRHEAMLRARGPLPGGRQPIGTSPHGVVTTSYPFALSNGRGRGYGHRFRERGASVRRSMRRLRTSPGRTSTRRWLWYGTRRTASGCRPRHPCTLLGFDRPLSLSRRVRSIVFAERDARDGRSISTGLDSRAMPSDRLVAALRNGSSEASNRGSSRPSVGCWTCGTGSGRPIPTARADRAAANATVPIRYDVRDAASSWRGRTASPTGRRPGQTLPMSDSTVSGRATLVSNPPYVGRARRCSRSGVLREPRMGRRARRSRLRCDVPGRGERSRPGRVPACEVRPRAASNARRRCRFCGS